MTVKLCSDRIDLVVHMARIEVVQEQKENDLPPIQFIYPTLKKKHKKLGRNQQALPSDGCHPCDSEEGPDNPDSDGPSDPRSKPPKQKSRKEELFKELASSRKRYAKDKEKTLQAQRLINRILTEDQTEIINMAGTDMKQRQLLREELSRLRGCNPRCQCSCVGNCQCAQ